jgi:hypothetical protein
MCLSLAWKEATAAELAGHMLMTGRKVNRGWLELWKCMDLRQEMPKEG